METFPIEEAPSGKRPEDFMESRYLYVIGLATRPGVRLFMIRLDFEDPVIAPEDQDDVEDDPNPDRFSTQIMHYDTQPYLVMGSPIYTLEWLQQLAEECGLQLVPGVPRSSHASTRFPLDHPMDQMYTLEFRTRESQTDAQIRRLLSIETQRIQRYLEDLPELPVEPPEEDCPVELELIDAEMPERPQSAPP